MIGRTVDHYRIVERLGSGGMGVVYKAWDSELERHVALKFLPPETARDPQAAARLRHEAVAASGLGSDHVQTVHDLGTAEDGQLFLVLECYEGRTLQQRLAEGPLPPDEAAEIGRQAALGLAAAHDAGLVHRDVKPANIFLTRDGTVKILDFGLARLAGEAGLTRTGTVPGTAAYLAPEQARGGEADARSDVWALGVTLYECLTGQRPFRGEYEQAVIYGILNEEPVPAADLNPAVPPRLAAVLDRALAKDPARRPRDGRELVAALGGAVPPPPRRRVRPGPRRAAAAAGLLILALALAAWLAPHLRPGRGAGTGPPTLAILPFENLGPPGDDSALAASLAEDLIIGLSQLEGLDVLSRAAVRRYGETRPEPRTVGRDLGAGYVLEGTFRRIPDGLRISAQLIEAGTGITLWAGRFDGPFADIFAIEDTVTVRVARALAVPTGEAEYALVTRHWTRNVEAYSHYLVGREKYWDRDDPDRFAAAGELFARALEIDPLYAPAMAGLSQCRAAGFSFGTGTPDDLQQALELARRAKEIDPTLAVAWRAEGYALEEAKRFTEAAASYRRALELNPGLETVYNRLGRLGFGRGEGPARCYEVFERGIAARPYEDVNYVEYAQILVQQGKTAEAEAVLERGLAKLPGGPGLRYVQGVAACARGDVDRGVGFWLGRLAQQPDDFRPYARLVLDLPGYGRQAAADSLAARMLAQWPASPLILRIAARHAYGRGDYARAEDLYRQALAVDGAMYIAQAGLADCLAATDRPDEARALIRDLLARWAGLPDAYLVACWFQEAQGDWEDVRATAARWVAAYPEDGLARYHLGAAQSALGDFEPALESHRQGLAIDWSVFGNYRGFCRAAAALDTAPEERLATAGRAVEIWPGQPFAWMLSGEAAEALARDDEAVEAYERAHALDARWGGGAALRALAGVHGRAGRPRREIAAYLELVELFPADADAWAQVACRAWHALDDRALARRAADRVRELGGPGPLVRAAGIYSRLDELDLAYAALDSAVAGGYRDRAALERDPDLAAARRDPRFPALLARLD